ncbi:hypothetical protein AMTRI_Chr01g133570 [Amborella trichopoda]
MPYCEVRKCKRKDEVVKLFYTTYGHGNRKVLFIIGLAGTHESWGPQIRGLTNSDMSHQKDEEEDVRALATLAMGQESIDKDEIDDNGESGIQVCAFDNRGMGRSSVPKKKSEYTTTIMAKDALAVMDSLGWQRAHIFGHSMGAMIACKLASIAPNRVLSLALLNATGGGYECFPKIDRQTISLAIRFLRAKTPEERAAVDLDTHYSKEYLDECIGSNTRRRILYQEYVKAISSTGMQSNQGFEGQVNACWTHKMTSKDYDVIRSSGLLISVIHGRYDVIAQINHARRIAQKLYPSARMVELHGGHLVSHERPDEVNQALMELIEASETKLDALEWSNLPKYGTGSPEHRISPTLELSLLYVIGLLVMLFQRSRRLLRSLGLH